MQAVCVFGKCVFGVAEQSRDGAATGVQCPRRNSHLHSASCPISKGQRPGPIPIHQGRHAYLHAMRFGFPLPLSPAAATTTTDNNRQKNFYFNFYTPLHAIRFYRLCLRRRACYYLVFILLAACYRLLAPFCLAV